MSTIDNSNLSYTSRDYESILTELINTIPLLTKKWTSKEESDPGIVLVKLMAMVGDMLSYNLDKQALELYPESVTQRKNAYQIYKLLGYKMHWYKSARCTAYAYLVGNTPNTVAVKRFSKFSVGDTNYTNIEDVMYTQNNTDNSPVMINLIQGTPKTPPLIQSDLEYQQDSWYDSYGYNLSADDFSDNKYYFPEYNVDEDNIVLCDKYGPWILVEDIDLVSDVNNAYYNNRYFDFGVDEYDRPFIRLCQSWNRNNKGPSEFKLFYVLSSGSNGRISAGGRGYMKSSEKNINEMTNNESSEGFDPETPEEAWKNSRNWVNTNTTLITCDDFTKAVKRIEGVDNAVALDWMTDFQDPLDPATKMQNYEVRIYVVPNSDYIAKTDSGNPDQVLRQLYEKIDNYLKSNKILHLIYTTYWDKVALAKDLDDPAEAAGKAAIQLTDKITHCLWSIEGTIFYTTPLSKKESDEIIDNINSVLRLKYSTKNVDFNQEIKYIDVVNTILLCDSRILYVNLNPLKYTCLQKNSAGVEELVEVPESKLTGRFTETYNQNSYIDSNGVFNGPGDEPIDQSERDKIDVTKGFNPCLYEIEIPEENLPIKPSSLSIKIETGNFTIYDNGNGQLFSGIVEGENSILANGSGTIDYGRYKPYKTTCSSVDEIAGVLSKIPEEESRDGRICIVTVGDTKYYYKYQLNYKDLTYSWVETTDKPGLLRFELRYAVASPLIVTYKKNQLSIAEYKNLDSLKFFASSDSLKRKG